MAHSTLKFLGRNVFVKACRMTSLFVIAMRRLNTPGIDDRNNDRYLNRHGPLIVAESLLPALMSKLSRSTSHGNWMVGRVIVPVPPLPSTTSSKVFDPPKQCEQNCHRSVSATSIELSHSHNSQNSRSKSVLEQVIATSNCIKNN
jgi:hypothetical protein